MPKGLHRIGGSVVPDWVTRETARVYLLDSSAQMALSTWRWMLVDALEEVTSELTMLAGSAGYVVYWPEDPRFVSAWPKPYLIKTSCFERHPRYEDLRRKLIEVGAIDLLWEGL